MKKFLVAVLLSILTLAIVGWFAWPPLAERYLQQTLRTLASKRNNLGWSGLRVRGTSVSVESAEGWLPLDLAFDRSRYTVPIPFSLNDIEVSVPLTSLLTGSPQLKYSLTAYHGSISGELSNIRTTPRVSLAVKDVKFSEHPTFLGFGVSAGALSLTISDLVAERNEPLVGTFDVSIRDLLVPALPQTMTLITIPAMEHVSAQGSGSLAAMSGMQHINVDKMTLTSHLFSVEGSYKSTLPARGGRGSCEGTASVSLSDAGKEVFGSAVVLGSAFTNTPLPSGTTHFKVRLTGTTGTRECQPPLVYSHPFCLNIQFYQ